MKGGVILFRGTGAAGCRYLESDRSRADDYYLKGGTTLAAFTVTDGSGEVLATSELDAEVYARWVAEVVSHLLGGRRVADQLARLSEREHAVLDLMAQGLSNFAIAQRLVVEIKTIETHVARIMHKLDLQPSADDNRRVRAVLA